MKLEIALWEYMESDDWIRAANFLEKEAEKALANNPGGFGTAHALANLQLAKAYYLADSDNEKMMRRMHGRVFWEAFERRVSQSNV